ncbi:VWA domain-containing protein [uncultured Paraglaciecola sp.]|uniref:vWA domain-containing protein n=1 Tax=uncultured Paraglaciecola sp. TaxID=1765024 RepID=UPI0030DCF9B3|tara:strand:- start:90376 stop:92256 length:1881 start_codon:yes stop_codon:yes gene_type:complete
MIESFSVLNEFHFIRPHWLWLIIPLLIMVGLIRYVHKQQSGWQSVLASHLYQHLITTQGIKKVRPPLFLLGFCWVLATVSLAGPTWERLPQPVYQLNAGKVVLMDMSLSMRATDVKPDRLTRAKYKAIDLVNAITEGETGLVAYAGDAFTISPLSSDAQNLTTLIPSLTPEIMPIAGSDPALGLQAAIELLSNAGYQQGEIFWITDGINNQQMKEVSEIFNTSMFRLSVLGVGTEEGAPIQLIDGELLKDSRGAIVVPKLTVNNLKSLSRSSGGRYASMQSDDSDINYLIEQNLIEQTPTKDEDDNKESFGDKWQEMGPYLLLLIIPFAAYSFRRGIVTVLFIGVLLPTYSPQARADWWQDMWKTPDQQAMQAYNKNEYEQAANTFDDPLWQGTAHYKNGDYQAALESFSQLSPNDKHYTDATYNAANSLAQLGEVDQAIAAYEKVLEQQPDHEDALANKTLLERLKNQQEQQNDQSGEQSQDKQDQDSENQEQQEGQNDDQQQEGEQSQDPQQSENSEQSDSQAEDSEQQSQAEKDQQEQKEAEQQQAEAEAEAEKQKSEQEQQAQALQQGQEELTDEQKEQMQRMQNLLNRVPDDPAFLLKRKMQIESQRRKRERLPTHIQGNW